MKKDVIVGLVVVAAVAGAIMLNPSAKKETKPLTFSQRHEWAFRWRKADEIVPEPTNDPLRERSNVLDVGDDMDVFD